MDPDLLERLDELNRRLSIIEARTVPMVSENYRDLSDRLYAEAQEMERGIALGTREQWNAHSCLREAADRLFAVFAWLERDKSNREVT